MTAKKTMRSVATAPPLPNKATAASGRTRPADTSAADMRAGYDGKAGLVSRASAESPIVVAARKGIAN